MHSARFHYWDIHEIFPTLYYKRLIHSKECTSFLQEEFNKLNANSSYIGQYPCVQENSLDFFYTSYRHSCSLNDDFFEDLINLGWRGIGWASWLALITPYSQKTYSEIIKVQQRACEKTFGEKFYNKALINCHTSLHPHNDYETNILAIAEHFKKHIAHLPPMPIAMRRWPPPSYFQHQGTRKNLILKEYKTNGTDAAMDLYKSTRKYIWDYNYVEWLRFNQDKKSHYVMIAND